MRDVFVHRPITVPSLALVLGVKPYELLAGLIRRAVFPAPGTVLDDHVAVSLAASMGVRLRIMDDGGDARWNKPSE